MMKRKMMAAVLTMAAAMIGGCGNSADAADTAKDTAQNTADKTVYKVGIVQYVDDAHSLMYYHTRLIDNGFGSR